jgi:hypothetical protein
MNKWDSMSDVRKRSSLREWIDIVVKALMPEPKYLKDLSGAKYDIAVIDNSDRWEYVITRRAKVIYAPNTLTLSVIKGEMVMTVDSDLFVHGDVIGLQDPFTKEVKPLWVIKSAPILVLNMFKYHYTMFGDWILPKQNDLLFKAFNAKLE